MRVGDRDVYLTVIEQVVGLVNGDAAADIAAHQLTDRLDGFGGGADTQFEPEG